MVETQVAARLLAAVRSDAALAALDGVLGGDDLVTLAVRPVRDGVAALTPAGAVCDALHYRRVRDWARVWGDADAGYRRAAAARYGSTVERER